MSEATKAASRRYYWKDVETKRSMARAKGKRLYAADPEKFKAREKERREKQGVRFKKYGITKVEFDRMMELQQGRCAICLKEADLRLDHDHDRGILRDLLCHNCNVLLGHAKESPDVLMEAYLYLARWNRTEVEKV